MQRPPCLVRLTENVAAELALLNTFETRQVLSLDMEGKQTRNRSNSSLFGNSSEVRPPLTGIEKAGHG